MNEIIVSKEDFGIIEHLKIFLSELNIKHVNYVSLKEAVVGFGCFKCEWEDIEEFIIFPTHNDTYIIYAKKKNKNNYPLRTFLKNHKKELDKLYTYFKRKNIIEDLNV